MLKDHDGGASFIVICCHHVKATDSPWQPQWVLRTSVITYVVPLQVGEECSLADPSALFGVDDFISIEGYNYRDSDFTHLLVGGDLVWYNYGILIIGIQTSTGWWFGTCYLLFFHILGISSSQVTFIFFRGVETTNQYLYVFYDMLHCMETVFLLLFWTHNFRIIGFDTWFNMYRWMSINFCTCGATHFLIQGYSKSIESAFTGLVEVNQGNIYRKPSIVF